LLHGFSIQNLTQTKLFFKLFICRIEFNVVCSSNARGIDGDVEIEIENSSNLRMTKRYGCVATLE